MKSAEERLTELDAVFCRALDRRRRVVKAVRDICACESTPQHLREELTACMDLLEDGTR